MIFGRSVRRGMGLVIRKLVLILFLSHTFEKPAVVEDSTRKLGESFNDLHFKGLQYGCSERGTEKIIHFTRQSLELHPDHDHFFMDAENAFNQVSRWKALSARSRSLSCGSIGCPP